VEASGKAPLRIRGVTKTWPRIERAVLDAVDLDCEPGTLTWLGGDNGAGKTTLLRVACGMIAPDEGTVEVEGFEQDLEPRECKRRMGFLSAGNSGLHARLTTRQQLDFWSRIAMVAPARRAAAVDGALERFGLSHLAKRRLDRISMGERQRVRIAMAFLHEPTVVLLDEPRNSLDPAGLQVLVECVADLRARGGAALWCSPTGEIPGAAVDVALMVSDGRLEPA
jgi:ABC-2 type transport system ATP-binding protein